MAVFPFDFRKVELVIPALQTPEPRIPGGMAEWSCSGLQSRVRRFDSDSRLQLLATKSFRAILIALALARIRSLRAKPYVESILLPGW